jgi:hypothetical protein
MKVGRKVNGVFTVFGGKKYRIFGDTDFAPGRNPSLGGNSQPVKLKSFNPPFD